MGGLPAGGRGFEANLRAGTLTAGLLCAVAEVQAGEGFVDEFCANVGCQNNKKTGKNFQKLGVEDLVLLPKVNEDAVLENLKKRYMNDIIYTNIGPVLVSVNPYKALPITDETWINRYKGKFRHELDPHIYALAEETYRAMKGETENQCCIIRFAYRPSLPLALY